MRCGAARAGRPWRGDGLGSRSRSLPGADAATGGEPLSSPASRRVAAGRTVSAHPPKQTVRGVARPQGHQPLLCLAQAAEPAPQPRQPPILRGPLQARSQRRPAALLRTSQTDVCTRHRWRPCQWAAASETANAGPQRPSLRLPGARLNLGTPSARRSMPQHCRQHLPPQSFPTTHPHPQQQQQQQPGALVLRLRHCRQRPRGTADRCRARDRKQKLLQRGSMRRETACPEVNTKRSPRLRGALHPPTRPLACQALPLQRRLRWLLPRL